MSKYIFIASDFEIPEVDLTNEQIITPIEAKLKGIKPPCFNEEIILNIINNYHSSLIIK